MNTNSHHGSAKIYQFPVRVRPGIGVRQEETKATIDIHSPRIVTTACGSGWYHEAAIEAERTGEH